jgi:predicted HicB family RNase H-like nuclease
MESDSEPQVHDARAVIYLRTRRSVVEQLRQEATTLGLSLNQHVADVLDAWMSTSNDQDDQKRKPDDATTDD